MLRIPVVLLLLAAVSAHAANLEIEVRGFKGRNGLLHLAVFDNAEGFAMDVKPRAMVSESGELITGIFAADGQWPHPPVETLMGPVTGKAVTFGPIDLPPGTYAVGVYQDTNNDQRLGTTFTGRCLEPCGLSNNPPLRDQNPTWENSSFELPAEGRRIVIDLQ